MRQYSKDRDSSNNLSCVLNEYYRSKTKKESNKIMTGRDSSQNLEEVDENSDYNDIGTQRVTYENIPDFDYNV